MDVTYRLIAFKARGDQLQEIFANSSAFNNFKGRHPEKDNAQA